MSIDVDVLRISLRSRTSGLDEINVARRCSINYRNFINSIARQIILLECEGSDEGDIAETLASIKINNHLGKQLERILAYSATTITMPGFKDSGTWKHLTTVLQKWANFVRV
ncbi:hypothetical protein Y032_0722g1837 [Ancylostoma ceylanicum]|uniref:Uncharacterized protein n=1 Tax=Ancylostoma ceylanicum TaxID=53326 RepID=A0A016WEV2_9BILA|nr:hypothetical protein Y032_0722g1837 [Ancylostoma ceylanicum]